MVLAEWLSNSRHRIDAMSLQDWGNFGSAVGGLATLVGVVLAVAGFVRWRKEQREKQRAEAAADLLAAHVSFCEMAAYAAKAIRIQAFLSREAPAGEATRSLQKSLESISDTIRKAVAELASAKARAAAHLEQPELQLSIDAEDEWGSLLMDHASASGTSVVDHRTTFTLFFTMEAHEAMFEVIQARGQTLLRRVARLRGREWWLRRVMRDGEYRAARRRIEVGLAKKLSPGASPASLERWDLARAVAMEPGDGETKNPANPRDSRGG